MSNMRSKSKVSLCSGDKLYPFGDSCHSILIHVSNTKHGQHQHIFEWSFVRKLPLGRLELKIYHKVYYLSCVKFTQGYRFTSLQQRSVVVVYVCLRGIQAVLFDTYSHPCHFSDPEQICWKQSYYSWVDHGLCLFPWIIYFI